MGDIAYTLGVRRTHHDHRFSFVARSKEEAIDALDLFLAGAAGNAGRKGKLVFVFPGQGSQWIGMGRELFEHEPVFRASLERCDEMLRSLALRHACRVRQTHLQI